LADVEEFCGKIKAGKDSQSDPDFCIVARVEALIAGWSMGEALRRAEAYRKAGADAILIHSKKSKADEILAFKKEWGDRLPVVIVPTKYYSTPTEAFEAAGINLIIWANHLMRAAVTTMQKTAAEIHSTRSLITVEDHVASVNELFRLQGADELEAAEEAYLPKTNNQFSAIVLAASRGKELGKLTSEIPKAMIPVGGKPMLESQIQVFTDLGIKAVTVVRGYRKEAIRFVGPEYVDNDQYESTRELYSLSLAANRLSGNVIISYGDVLFRKFIPSTLLETKGDIAIVVDANWKESRNQGRYADLVACSEPYRMEVLEQSVTAKSFHSEPAPGVSGEWIGLMKLTAKGTALFKDELAQLSRQEGFKEFHIARLLDSLLKKGVSIEVAYISGNWIDIDSIEDLSVAREF
jgi:phosphoenolpyruvate phosphomutase